MIAKISYEGLHRIEQWEYPHDAVREAIINAIEYLKENKKTTNRKYQKLNEVSKATAKRDLTELFEKHKLIVRTGEIESGTIYKLIGSIGS